MYALLTAVCLEQIVGGVRRAQHVFLSGEQLGVFSQQVLLHGHHREGPSAARLERAIERRPLPLERVDHCRHVTRLDGWKTKLISSRVHKTVTG